MQTAQPVQDRAASPTVQPAIAPSGIKTILFHVYNDDGLQDRLQIALSLTRTFGAHLHLLHVSPIEAYTVTDAFAVFVSPEIIEAIEKEATKLRESLSQQLQDEDVSWDYEEVTGGIMPHLIQKAALADLVLVGREPEQREFGGPAITFLGDLLQQVRTPLFIIGDNRRTIDPFGPALIAWDGSCESANAMRSAVPLLGLASQVRLVTIKEKEARFPSIVAVEYLSRHGIHAELIDRPKDAGSVEEQLLDQAALDRASYIVMGGYGHSRAGEFLFGGVTRTLLKRCSIPLILSR